MSIAPNSETVAIWLLFPVLIHLLHQTINLLLSIPQITPFNKMLKLPCPESARRITQLERPQEVARLLEIRPNSEHLVDQVLHTHNPKLAQAILDDLVVGERNPLLVDFPVAALVDQLAHGFERGVAVGDVGLDDFEHFRSSFCELDENAVVDLQEAEELEDLAGFGCNFVDAGGGQSVVERRYKE